MTAGDIEKSMLPTHFPFVITLADQVLHIPNRDAMRQMTRTYRANLVAEGYARTEVEMLHEGPAGQRGTQVLVTWRHYSSRQALLRETPASYFAQRSPDGAWVITLAEFLEPPHQRYTAGLPIYDPEPKRPAQSPSDSDGRKTTCVG